MPKFAVVLAFTACAGAPWLVGELAAGHFAAMTPSYKKTQNPNSELIVVEGTAVYVGTPDPNDNHAWIQTTLYDWWSGNPGENTGVGYNRNGPFATGDLLICTDAQNGCPGRGFVPRRPCNMAQYSYQGRTGAAIYHQHSPEITTAHGSTDRPACKPEEPQLPGPPDNPCDDPPINQFVIPVVGGPQLAQALPNDTIDTLRRETRGSMWYAFDEWAVLAVEKTDGRVGEVEVLAASSSDYASFRREGLIEGIQISRESPNGGGRWDLFGKGALESYFRAGRSILLAVDEPVHVHNHRWIEKPLPRLLPGSIPAFGEPGLAVVRAEHDEGGALDSLEVLYSDRLLVRAEHAYLRSHLTLEHASDKPHRTVLFAVVRLGEIPSMLMGKVVIAQCCCPNIDCGPEI